FMTFLFESALGMRDKGKTFPRMKNAAGTLILFGTSDFRSGAEAAAKLFYKKIAYLCRKRGNHERQI
ncbi:MAG: hypothetical protein K2J53_02005, partial [Alistipes sp.]|nr:hypothetical protein [Alistipes sp.]